MNIFINKTQVEKFDKMGVIYDMVCDTSKEDKKAHKYIGETSRIFKQRIKENCVFSQWEQADLRLI